LVYYTDLTLDESGDEIVQREPKIAFKAIVKKRGRPRKSNFGKDGNPPILTLQSERGMEISIPVADEVPIIFNQVDRLSLLLRGIIHPLNPALVAKGIRLPLR